jgi:hypothetical protein
VRPFALLLVSVSLSLLAPAALAKTATKPAPTSVKASTGKPAAPKTAPLAAPKELLEQQVILRADGPYMVDLTNLRGRVLVRGWNKNVVYVHGVKRFTHALAGQEATYFANTKIKVTQPEAGAVKIQTVVAGSGKLPNVAASRIPHILVDYEVFVPPDCALTIRQESGPVTVVGVSGKVDAFSRDGDLALTNVSGWAEATNERGNLKFKGIDGDAVGKSLRGTLGFQDISGDVKAATGTGRVRIDVSPRFVGEVGYQTVSGDFRSDLITFQTNMEPGDKGYRGILRGPLAGREAPPVRYTIDTESGEAIIAAETTK